MSCRQKGDPVVPLWRVGFVVWCLGLVLTSRGAAVVLTGPDWSDQSNPMGEDWLVCSATMPGGPGGGGQRTKDGAFGWNDANFTFTCGADACSSAGVYPLPNNVNQVDF